MRALFPCAFCEQPEALQVGDVRFERFRTARRVGSVAVLFIADARLQRRDDAEVHMHGLVVDGCRVGCPCQERAEGGFCGRNRGRGVGKLCAGAQCGMQARPHRFAVAFRPSKLSRDAHGDARNRAFQAQGGVQKARGIDERVAVHDPIARELGVL